MQSCKRAEDLQEKFQPNDSTEELKSVADNSVGTKKSEVDNIDYKRLAIEINKLQVTTRENLTDSHTNPDVPRKHLPRNAQDDTSATHRRNETTKENSIASVETQHLENTAGKSLVPLTARKAIQFSGLTESAGKILKDKPDCDDHPSQSQSEMKQNSPKEHQSRIAMPDKIECLLPRSDGVAPIPTPESDGRDKTQCSAPKSDCHIGMTTIRTPEYDGIKKIRHVKSRCKKVTGNVESENKKKEAEDQKNDKDSKTIQETGNTELLTGCIKVDDFNFKDSPPSPLNSDPKPPNIHKGGTAKPKLDSRTKVRHSAPKSDGFGRKTVRTDRKPLLFHNQ